MSRRNYSNNKENRRKKSKAKKWITIVCAFLAGLCVMGAVSSITAEKDLNPDNLIKVENYFENLPEKTDGGLEIDWKEDGRFVLSGKHSDDDIANNALYTLAFTNVTLNEGVYTFTPGNYKCDDETYGMYYIINGETPVYVFDDETTIHIDGTSTVEFGFCVKNNYYILYAEFAPVLVSGDKVGSFFVED